MQGKGGLERRAAVGFRFLLTVARSPLLYLSPSSIVAGTLLGAVREGGLLSHEFDLDLATRREACPSIVRTLKPLALEAGLKVYLPGQFIAKKQNKLLGYSPYLHKSCLRIYDANEEVYIDFDWYATYTPRQALATQVAVAMRDGTRPPVPPEEVEGVDVPKPLPTRPGGLAMPAGYDPRLSSETILCNEEALSDDGDPGACRLERDMLPLGEAMMRPGLRVKVPADPEASLVAMYGPDWRVPHGKGYKRLMCSWFPRGLVGLWALLVFLLTAPTLIVIGAKRAVQEYRRRTNQRSYLPLNQLQRATVPAAADPESHIA